jgi:hypothetical protein
LIGLVASLEIRFEALGVCSPNPREVDADFPEDLLDPTFRVGLLSFFFKTNDLSFEAAVNGFLEDGFSTDVFFAGALLAALGFKALPLEDAFADFLTAAFALALALAFWTRSLTFAFTALVIFLLALVIVLVTLPLLAIG